MRDFRVPISPPLLKKPCNSMSYGVFSFLVLLLVSTTHMEGGGMSFVQDMRNLEHHQVLLGGFVFAATLAPGFLTIFHFKPDLVEKYDFFKIVLFSMALTVPVLLLNQMWLTLIRLFPPKGNEFVGSLAIASIFTMGLFLSSLVIAYLEGFPFKRFLLHLVSTAVTTNLVIGAAWWLKGLRGKTPPPGSSHITTVQNTDM